MFINPKCFPENCAHWFTIRMRKQEAQHVEITEVWTSIISGAGTDHPVCFLPIRQPAKKSAPPTFAESVLAHQCFKISGQGVQLTIQTFGAGGANVQIVNVIIGASLRKIYFERSRNQGANVGAKHVFPFV